MNVVFAVLNVLLKAVFVALVLLLQMYLLLVLLQNQYTAASRRLEDIFREKVYPRLRLPQVLRQLKLGRLLPSWKEEFRLRKGPLPAKPQILLPAEQEQEFPYYARTGQLVCDVDRGMPVNRWYQPEDWVRDVVAGVAGDELLVQPVEREKLEQEPPDSGRAKQK